MEDKGKQSMPLNELFEIQKANLSIVAKSTARERIAKLKKLKSVLINYQDEIRQAMYASFSKPSIETDFSELIPITRNIDHVCKNLSYWMQSKKKATPIEFLGSSSYIHFEPKGIVLIIAPWNYPFNLVFDPLVGAIAAGNCVIIKPSEISPIASPLIKKIISEIFKPDEICVIEGDSKVATELLKLPFNHIFFTGSTNVGKIVMKAAADNLASVTLELGGKSPAIVHSDANIKTAARKITFGKFLNTGQTCIAPDYVLVHSSVKDEFIREINESIHSFYGKDAESIKKSPDFARIINNNHFGRIMGYLSEAISKGAKIVTGGENDPNERYIAPTVLTDIPEDCTILKEEIFGPILPVVEYSSLDNAIQYINEKSKPLSLYIFSADSKIQASIIQNTSAGGSTVNDCLLHMFNVNLPFGGVNESGLGKSRGFYGFQAFSNERSILYAKGPISVSKLISAPYTTIKKRFVNFLLKRM